MTINKSNAANGHCSNMFRTVGKFSSIKPILFFFKKCNVELILPSLNYTTLERLSCKHCAVHIRFQSIMLILILIFWKLQQFHFNAKYLHQHHHLHLAILHAHSSIT